MLSTTTIKWKEKAFQSPPRAHWEWIYILWWLHEDVFVEYHLCLSTKMAGRSMRFRCHGRRIARFASTLPFWCVFDCPIKTFENDRIARCDPSWTLCACQSTTHVVHMTSSFSFWCVLTVHSNTVCFRFDTLLRAFFKSMSFRWKRSAY